jgi:phage terminase small subunit
MPAGHFHPGDLPLLSDFCETVGMLRQVTKELWKSGLIADGKRSPHLLAKSDLARHLATLAVQLRLSPRARSDSRKKQPVSTHTARASAILRGKSDE